MANTTWNPADRSNVNLSSGNLVATSTAVGWVRTVDKVLLTGGSKTYWEIKPTVWSNGNTGHGLTSSTLSSPSGASPAGMLVIYNSGQMWLGNSYSGSTLGTRANNDILGVAIDPAAKLAWMRVTPSGNWNGSGTANPATGTGGLNVSAVLSGAADAIPVAAFGTASESVLANFGDSAFNGTIPSGFTTLAGVGGAAVPQQCTVMVVT